MNENSEILKSLGELTGLVKASRGDIATLSIKHDQLAASTQAIATAMQVMQAGYNAKELACTKEFEDINNVLTGYTTTINELKTKTVVDAGVDDYKGKRRVWVQWALGVIGGILMVLTTINQLPGIESMFQSKSTTTHSAYGAALVPKDTTFVIKTDTIKGK